MMVNLMCKSARLLVASSMLFCGYLAHAQFTIMPDSYITVKQGSTLQIGSDFDIKSTSTGSGYLVDQTTNGDVNITGNITVERYMSSDYWHNSSSPVSDASSSVYLGTDLVFYYDETLIINDWMFGWVMYSGALTVMKGYDVYFENTPETIQTILYTATGVQTINTGTYNIPVQITTFPNGESDDHRGWNLLGNPYPSPIDWQVGSGWDKTDINDAKYIWDGPNDNYTIFLGGGSPIGINGGTQFIPSNQGFWVQAAQNGSVQVDNSTRIGETAATPDFYKGSDVDYPLLDLLAEANGYSDECIIRFIPGTTTAFDLNYDATKLFSQGNEVPQICTVSGNSQLAVNTLPALDNELMVPLSFQCKKSGDYSIRLTELSNLDPFTDVYLKDELEGKLIHLSQELSYSFFHSTGNKNLRFKIYFNPSEDIINGIDPPDYFSVFENNGRINILKNTTKSIDGEVWIYNTIGQAVYQAELSDDKLFSIRLNVVTGYYYINIRTDQQISNYKVFIGNW